MTYLRTPEESSLFEAALDQHGSVPNHTKVFALAPEVHDAWVTLNSAVKAGMDPRRYALVTLMAARRLGSRYCTLALTAALREHFYDDETLHLIITDRHSAPLDPADIAAMDFAVRIAADPHCAGQAEADVLRAHGFTEADIFHVVLAVAARRFLAGALDAAGVTPDVVYESLFAQAS